MSRRSEERDWSVLLIGGPSAVGKTGAAKRIATVSGATLLQVDDVWRALRRAIDPKDSPLLHTFSAPDVWERSTAELVALRRELAALVSSSLELVVADHLAASDPVVIEGVWITPEFAARDAYAGVAASRQRRAVMVLEGDPAAIAPDDRAAAMEAGYARWLRTQALMRKVPIVEARPVPRLAERILSVL